MQLRLALLALMIAAAFFGLLARLWYLQIYLGDELLHQSIGSITHTIPTRSPRGDIVDRAGQPLADSRQSLSLEIEADYQKINPLLLIRLAPLLNTTPQALADLLNQDRASPADSFRVADNLSPNVVAKIEEHRLYLTGASIQPNPIRHYPLPDVASQLLGYLSLINADEIKALARFGYRAGDYVGKGGIERQYNALLRGVDGGRQVEVDPSGKIRRVLREIAPHPGNRVYLTLDRRVQHAAVEALRNEGRRGAAVAIDPRSGDVLALATYPTYDLQQFSTHRSAKLWGPLVQSPDHPLENRAISAQYPPASTFKPLVACEGLQDGRIGPNMTVYCARGMAIGKNWKGCWKFHGSVDFPRSISESCDTFYYVAALRMGIDPIVQAAQAFGYGSKTGIDLGPEASGEVPTREWRARHFRRWYQGQTANCAIGQGEIYATPLQVANAVAAIANGGIVYRPHLLLKAVDYTGRITDRGVPQVLRKVPYSESVVQRVREAMRLTVTKGTGKIVAMPNVEVAAKTGTAQTRQTTANHGWMTCFAPYASPRIAIAVIVEEGHHGAESGGPVAKAMLQAYFGPTKPPAAAPEAPAPPASAAAHTADPAAGSVSPTVDSGLRLFRGEPMAPPHAPPHPGPTSSPAAPPPGPNQKTAPPSTSTGGGAPRSGSRVSARTYPSRRTHRWRRFTRRARSTRHRRRH